MSYHTWWEKRVLKNVSMHSKGLSQSEIIDNTCLEHDVVGGALGYLAPNGYLDSGMELRGSRNSSDMEYLRYYTITEKGRNLLKSYGR